MTIQTKNLDGNEISKGLSDDQVLKIETTIKKLALHAKNANAITLAYNLKMSKDIPEKRKWIVLFYTSSFQLLSFIQMAMNDRREASEFEDELKKLFKEL